MSRSILASLIFGHLLVVSAGSSPAQEVISASPDVTIVVGAGSIASDEDAAVDNLALPLMVESLGPIPPSADVIGLGEAVNGDRLIAVDTTVSLAGGVVARPGDVVRYDGSVYSIEFDASAEGVANGARTDAASLAPGGLLLSFDTTVDLGGGVIAADEDLVRWASGAFSIMFDGSANGIDSSLDIDAAHDMGGGAFVVSFDTTGILGGIVFDDEDLMRFDGTGWSLEYDASAADSAWAAADLDAVAVPEPGLLGLLVAGSAGLLLAARAPRGSRRHG